jgi:hypothetical protein
MLHLLCTSIAYLYQYCLLYMVRMFWLASKFITVSLSAITDVSFDGVAYTYIRNFKICGVEFHHTTYASSRSPMTRRYVCAKLVAIPFLQILSHAPSLADAHQELVAYRTRHMEHMGGPPSPKGISPKEKTELGISEKRRKRQRRRTYIIRGL